MAEEAGGKALRVVFDSTADMPPQYANTLVIQHDQHDFTITLFDVRPPILLGPPELKEKQLEALETVRARCVGRFVVAATRMHEFVQVMQDNLQMYQASQRAQGRGE